MMRRDEKSKDHRRPSYNIPLLLDDDDDDVDARFKMVYYTSLIYLKSPKISGDV